MTFDPSTNRRSLLKTGASLLGVAATGGLAGCTDSIPGTGSSDSGGDSGRVGYVPSTAGGIGYVDVDAFLSDSQLREGINQTADEFVSQSGTDSDPPTIEDLLNEFQTENGVDPRNLNEFLAFTRLSEDANEDSGASIIWSDFSESIFTDSEFFDSDTQVSEESYKGYTLYNPEFGSPAAVLSEGTFAIGDEVSVKKVIDVREGDESGVSGSLASVYKNTRGMGRLAGAVPDDAFDSVESGQVDVSALDGVTHASTSVYADGSNRVMDISLLTDSSEGASDVQSVLEGGRQLASSRLQQMQSQSTGGSGQAERFMIDGMLTYLNEAEVSTDGSTVTVSYAASPTVFARNSPVLFVFAGVLINTAGFLQSSAEETGQRSTQQVTDRLQVVNTVGTDIEDDSISPVRATVKKAPGSADIDLRTVTVQWVDSDGVYDLINANANSSGGASGNFGVDTIKDDDSSIQNEGVLNDAADRARLTFDIGERDTVSGVDSGGITALETGEQATLKFVTQSGGETEVFLTVPDTLTGQNAVAL